MKGQALRLERIRKTYNDVAAVDDVSLAIQAGEFVTLLGPSGSGKTTTLMMIAGFEEPTSGEIWLGGTPLVHVPSWRRNFGMVFQSYSLFPHMTVAQNIGFPLRMRRVGKAERDQRIARALDLVRLPGMENRSPRELSGGQQQRVALARALVFDPPLLLMDEPLGALDRKLRESMQSEIRQLQRSIGITTVFVTHDQEEALLLSDRVAVMNAGRIEQLSSPREIYDRPFTRFVADFIGKSNFIDVRIVSEDGSSWAVSNDGLRFPLGDDVACHKSGTLMIRPERLRLLTPDETVGFAVDARVMEVEFAGKDVQYLVELPGGRILSVRERNASREQRLKGEACRIGCDRRDLVWI